MENKIYQICHNFKKNVKDIVAGIIIASFSLVFCFVWFIGPGLVFIKICGDEPVNSAFDVILIFVVVILPYFICYLFQEKIKKILSKIGNFIVNCINA